MDAGRGAGDGPVGHRVPGACGRRLPPALVYPDGGAGALRPRHPGERPRAVGDGTGGSGGEGALPELERSAHGRAPGGVDRARLPGPRGGGCGSPAGAAGGARHRAGGVGAPDPPPALLAALGTEPVWVGKTGPNYFLELPGEDAVRAASPDLPAMRSLGVRGVIVTARGSANPFDFVSRYFAPGVGIDEDPVTGSAHCALAPYWAGRLGKEEMLAYQASARGGVVRVRVVEDRVKLGGQAVTVLQGRLLAS